MISPEAHLKAASAREGLVLRAAGTNHPRVTITFPDRSLWLFLISRYVLLGFVMEETGTFVLSSDEYVLSLITLRKQIRATQLHYWSTRGLNSRSVSLWQLGRRAKSPHAYFQVLIFHPRLRWSSFASSVIFKTSVDPPESSKFGSHSALQNVLNLLGFSTFNVATFMSSARVLFLMMTTLSLLGYAVFSLWSWEAVCRAAQWASWIKSTGSRKSDT